MPSKALVFGIILVMLMGILIFMLEIFLPLSAKIEFDAICRKAILKIEVEGGLDDTLRGEILSLLTAKGFDNLEISGTENAKYGGEIFLKVGGDYTYSRLIKLFSRERFVRRMEYERMTISRKVIN